MIVRVNRICWVSLLLSVSMLSLCTLLSHFSGIDATVTVVGVDPTTSHRSYASEPALFGAPFLKDIVYEATLTLPDAGNLYLCEPPQPPSHKSPFGRALARSDDASTNRTEPYAVDDAHAVSGFRTTQTPAQAQAQAQAHSTADVEDTDFDLPGALLVRRGNCNFDTKALNAMKYRGVMYIIVYDNIDAGGRLIKMSSDGDSTYIDMGLIFCSLKSGLELIKYISNSDTHRIKVEITAKSPSTSSFFDTGSAGWIVLTLAGLFFFFTCLASCLFSVLQLLYDYYLGQSDENGEDEEGMRQPLLRRNPLLSVEEAAALPEIAYHCGEHSGSGSVTDTIDAPLKEPLLSTLTSMSMSSSERNDTKDKGNIQSDVKGEAENDGDRNRDGDGNACRGDANANVDVDVDSHGDGKGPETTCEATKPLLLTNRANGTPYAMSTMTTCTICLEDYEDGEILKVLPCRHTFHPECIIPWLTERQRLCPLCKMSVATPSSYSGDEENPESADQTPDSDEDDDEDDDDDEDEEDEDEDDDNPVGFFTRFLTQGPQGQQAVDIEEAGSIAHFILQRLRRHIRTQGNDDRNNDDHGDGDHDDDNNSDDTDNNTNANANTNTVENSNNNEDIDNTNYDDSSDNNNTS